MGNDDERRRAYDDYCRHWKSWFASLSPAEQAHLRELGCDKPEPFDFPRPRQRFGDDDEDEFFDPADLAVDRTDPRVPVVDFDSVTESELLDYCNHFGAALVWATKGKPGVYEMGVRVIALLKVMRPAMLGKMDLPLPKAMVRDLRKTLSGQDPLKTGRFFFRVLEWIRGTSSLIQLGKRAYSAIYVLRGDLIDAATCASIGGLDRTTRQAANKPMQGFSDVFSNIKALPMRANKTRKLCKSGQLKNRRSKS